MSRKDNIIQTLTERFFPEALEVLDESDRHAGHIGGPQGGETHFRVRITAGCFKDMNRLQRHRAINEALAGELKSGLHALAIEARSPDEPDPRASRRGG